MTKLTDLTKIKESNGKIFDFKDVIESIENHKVLPFNNQSLLDLFKQAAQNTITTINSAPLFKGRPNEFGNLVQWNFEKECVNLGMDYHSPTDASGRVKTSGYPDGFINFNNYLSYVEIKTFDFSKKRQTLRSFFYSPSRSSKIIHDASHLLIGFATQNLKLVDFHITDMYVKKVILKLEFNQNNKEIYKEDEEI